MLPRKDGWQVCREIREIAPKPVIMITAKGDDFDKVLGLDLIAHAEALKDTKEEDNGVSDELVAYINERIAARAAAKKAKNFAEADAIRAELLERGITLVDKREGTEFIIEK